MKHRNRLVIYLLKVVILHSYVEYPQGMIVALICTLKCKVWFELHVLHVLAWDDFRVASNLFRDLSGVYLITISPAFRTWSSQSWPTWDALKNQHSQGPISTEFHHSLLLWSIILDGKKQNKQQHTHYSWSFYGWLGHENPGLITHTQLQLVWDLGLEPNSFQRGFKGYIDDGKVPQQNVERARKIQTNMGDEFSVLVAKSFFQETDHRLCCVVSLETLENLDIHEMSIHIKIIIYIYIDIRAVKWKEYHYYLFCVDYSLWSCGFLQFRATIQKLWADPISSNWYVSL